MSDPLTIDAYENKQQRIGNDRYIYIYNIYNIYVYIERCIYIYRHFIFIYIYIVIWDLANV